MCDTMKRVREEEIAPHLKKSTQLKRLRKTKQPIMIEKDRTRGRYACLGHRLKHKRCPLDCPDRRPKPDQVAHEVITNTEIITEIKHNIVKQPLQNRSFNSNSIAKKNILQLEDCIKGKNQSSSTTIMVHREILSSSSTQDVEPTILERDANWDSFEWEGLGLDNEHYICLKDDHAWMDLKSSSHWEESKFRDSLFPFDTKPMDDHTKYEEDEIIDSWLNDDGMINSPSEIETGNSNDSLHESSSDRRMSNYEALEQMVNLLPKILLTREMLERCLNEPYFNRLVEGCFVRVKIGEYMDSPVYRIAIVDGVQDGCFFSYRLNRMYTTKGLSLQVGTSHRKVFRIDTISDQPPTEFELRLWQEEMEKAKVCLDPTEVEQKQEIMRVLHIKYPDFGERPLDVEPMMNEPIWNC